MKPVVVSVLCTQTAGMMQTAETSAARTLFEVVGKSVGKMEPAGTFEATGIQEEELLSSNVVRWI